MGNINQITGESRTIKEFGNLLSEVKSSVNIINILDTI